MIFFKTRVSEHLRKYKPRKCKLKKLIEDPFAICIQVSSPKIHFHPFSQKKRKRILSGQNMYPSPAMIPIRSNIYTSSVMVRREKWKEKTFADGK